MNEISVMTIPNITLSIFILSTPAIAGITNDAKKINPKLEIISDSLYDWTSFNFMLNIIISRV